MNFECGMESYAITLSAEKEALARKREKKKLRFTVQSPTFFAPEPVLIARRLSRSLAQFCHLTEINAASHGTN